MDWHTKSKDDLTILLMTFIHIALHMKTCLNKACDQIYIFIYRYIGKLQNKSLNTEKSICSTKTYKQRKLRAFTFSICCRSNVFQSLFTPWLCPISNCLFHIFTLKLVYAISIIRHVKSCLSAVYVLYPSLMPYTAFIHSSLSPSLCC